MPNRNEKRDLNWVFQLMPRKSTSREVLHEIFELQVDLRPDRLAVVFDFETATYREIDQRANRLAHYLRRRGVGRPKGL